MLGRTGKLQTVSPLKRPEFITIGLGGDAGVGKTHFLGTGEGTLLSLETEGGDETYSSPAFQRDPNSLPLENIHIIRVGEPGSYNNVNELVAQVTRPLDTLIRSKNEDGYSVIALDSLTELQAKFLKAHVSADPRQSYGAWKDAIHEIVTKIRQVPANRILTARLRVAQDEVNGGEMVQFAISPGAFEVVSGLFSAIGYMRTKKKGGRDIRYIEFNHTNRLKGKDRYDLGLVEEPTLKQVIQQVTTVNQEESK